MTGEEFIHFVTERFNLKGLRYVPSRVNPEGRISRIAVMGGSGGNYYMDALRNGADAFVTGDIFYHTAHDIQETPLFLVDAGHHIEVVCRKHTAGKICPPVPPPLMMILKVSFRPSFHVFRYGG